MYCPFPYPVIILYYLYKYKSIGNIYKLVQVYLYIFILVQPIIICYNNTCNRNGGGCSNTLVKGVLHMADTVLLILLLVALAEVIKYIKK